MLSIAPEHDSGEDTSSSDGSVNKLEGPDLSMIPEPAYSDDSDLEYEGPDLSMIPEPCYTTSDMSSNDEGVDTEVKGNASTSLDRLEIDQVKVDTDAKEDGAKTDKKSEGNDSTETELMNPADLPWPYSDSIPTGRLTHPSGGPWIPKFHDYCYIDISQ